MAHNEDKPYKCSKCDYASAHASNLRAHLMIHTGEKSHKCNQCDYASSLAANLRTHMKTHREHGSEHRGKSNKCKVCDFASDYVSALKVHLKTHTGRGERMWHRDTHSMVLHLWIELEEREGNFEQRTELWTVRELHLLKWVLWRWLVLLSIFIRAFLRKCEFDRCVQCAWLNI